MSDLLSQLAGPGGGNYALLLLLLLMLACAGAWTLYDGARMMRHLRMAERLMEDGMPEHLAMREAGCLFWRTPWYRRMFRPYPALGTRTSNKQ